MRDRILNHIDKKVLCFASRYVNIYDPSVLIIETANYLNIGWVSEENVHGIINLQKVNDIRRINKFFETVNSKIDIGEYYICCVETFQERRKRIFKKFPLIIAVPFYFIDFIYKRVFPKLFLTKKIYFALNQGKNRLLSRAETLGRLISCGFKIIDEAEINNLLYIVAEKINKPEFNHKASYGPLLKIKRVGYKGKIITVYKLRTMHPYAEYLQDYIFDRSSLKDGGKFDEDFRVTYWGRFLRKFWIDEFPMFLNYFKGDIKIVGVRPLSCHYFSLYKKDLQAKRIKIKPGLVPPYYVDLPKTLEEIMESEEKYLDSYTNKPLSTDVKYFVKAVSNIVFRNARSS